MIYKGRTQYLVSSVVFADTIQPEAVVALKRRSYISRNYNSTTSRHNCNEACRNGNRVEKHISAMVWLNENLIENSAV